MKLSQPQLIKQILKELHMDGENVQPKDTPAASSKILGRHSDSADFDGLFNYRSIIGKLNFLEKALRGDIAYAVHQCARFAACPKKEHGEAVRWIARYLKGTSNEGYFVKPDHKKGLEVHSDADFSGNWSQEDSESRDSAQSRHGYVISYAGCPIIWKSQLQNEIALSSCESKYTGLSYTLRDAIPMMELLKEMRKQRFKVIGGTPTVWCKAYEDNSGALEIAMNHKYRPRTKHLNVRLHHFRDYIKRKELIILPIRTNDQPADLLTKPLNAELLRRHRKTIWGW